MVSTILKQTFKVHSSSVRGRKFPTKVVIKRLKKEPQFQIVNFLPLPAPYHKPQVRLSVQSRRSDFAGPGSDEEDGDDDDLLDNDVDPDLGSELSLDDF